MMGVIGLVIPDPVGMIETGLQKSEGRQKQKNLRNAILEMGCSFAIVPTV
jgi:hypothetical protein